ncbi:polysaccharide biosynthesis C-terminal domain-containing protein [Echinicola sp. CAU 1574]|uniref:Polysaccharide biosynthesis C-terminal domain-containing protein n=1 Tax=Echinicola arenosa TaxID=2774144 RepID=A0ABR9ANS5_9BACT|nr:polysaccharide biosynthesis C-terminal domain-containing protein [Echinicola arenosa]MBD8490007.1 polysaccharide biosynthesis C-terminal domain-containing protein [Echinicola arenosa]
MSNLKKLAGQTAVYGISSILGRVINFLLLPLYISYLSKEALGSFTAIYAFIAFFNVIFTYGMETTFFRFSTGKGLEPDKVYNNVQSLVLTTSLSLGALLYLSAEQISIWMDYEGKAYLFKWTAMILTIDAVLAIPYAKLRVENKSLQFALTKLFNILLNVGFNIFFIVICLHIYEGKYLIGFQPLIQSFYHPEWGVDYILLSNLMANALIVPVLFFLSGKFTWSLEKSMLGPMWHYAFPLLFMGLAGVTNEVFSRFLFEYILPENFYPGLTSREAGGVFGANFKLAIFMNLIIQAFKYAAEPFFFSQSEDKNSPQLYARVMHWFIIFCSVLMIVVAVNLNIIGDQILGNKGYQEGLSIVPMLLMGYLMLGVYFNLSIWFKITDKTIYSFYITFTGALVTILVIVLLVPKLGYTGAALSTLATYVIMSIMCYLFGQKYYPIPYQTGKDIFYLLTAFVAAYVGFYIEVESEILTFLIRNALPLAFILLVFLLEKEEISQLKKKIGK